LGLGAGAGGAAGAGGGANTILTGMLSGGGVTGHRQFTSSAAMTTACSRSAAMMAGQSLRRQNGTSGPASRQSASPGNSRIDAGFSPSLNSNLRPRGGYDTSRSAALIPEHLAVVLAELGRPAAHRRPHAVEGERQAHEAKPALRHFL